VIEHVTSVVNEVRLLNNRLIQLVEELHRDSGITASQRAVLEFVSRNGPATVPAIARARGVTRQHIQVIVNELMSADLVEPKPNPAHQRSPNYALTETGQHTIDALLEREGDYLSAHLDGLDSERLAAAAATLAELRHALRKDTQ
jgi:DNA-binding MarR family transcriptional regulator